MIITSFFRTDRAKDATNLGLLSLAFWFVHACLRMLLIFRDDPYGSPFVSKPSWYIFHAVSIDYIWIFHWTLPWLALVVWLPSSCVRLRKAIQPTFFVLLFMLLSITLLDNEVQRFLGSHLSFGLANTYKDASSLAMLVEYTANDLSIPYLPLVVFVLLFPAVYGTWRLLQKWWLPSLMAFRGYRKLAVGSLVLYLAVWLFINVIWTGTWRMKKLAPVVEVARKELVQKWNEKPLSPEQTRALALTYQREWLAQEGDSLWKFPDPSHPMWRVPVDSSRQNSKPLNFLVIFLESHRAMNCGFLRPYGATGDATPFLDSLAANAHIWTRFQVSGIPTVGALLASHTGIAPCRTRTMATELSSIRLPSFASILKDHGWKTRFFSAADPAWDNLTPWMRKWYDGLIYDRSREDDSTFFNYACQWMADSLKADEPFVLSFITRSNHYPFNLAPGMTDAEKADPMPKRMLHTMRFTDRQLARFFAFAKTQPWFGNTVFCIMADHGFPQGEHGASTIGYGGYSESTWIPFLLFGGHPALQTPMVHTLAASQIDIAPTLMGLAGLRTSVPFQGHDLLREKAQGFALGAHASITSITQGELRVLGGFPGQSREGGLAMFDERTDMRQLHNLAAGQEEKAKAMFSLADSLLQLSDFLLSYDRVMP